MTGHFGSSLRPKCRSSRAKQPAWRNPRFQKKSRKNLWSTLLFARCWVWSEIRQNLWATQTLSLTMRTCKGRRRTFNANSSNYRFTLFRCLVTGMVFSDPKVLVHKVSVSVSTLNVTLCRENFNVQLGTGVFLPLYCKQFHECWIGRERFKGHNIFVEFSQTYSYGNII